MRSISPSDVDVSNHVPYRDVTLASWRVQWPATRLFAQLLVGDINKETIKAPCYLPFVGESTGGGWIPITKSQIMRTVFPCRDAIMLTTAYSLLVFSFLIVAARGMITCQINNNLAEIILVE